MTGNERNIRILVLTFTLFMILGVSAAAGEMVVQATTGTLTIDSIPSGASVYIDGAGKGSTPFTSRTIISGDHVVTLKMKGYEDFITTVTIPPGGTIQGVYTMVAKIASTPRLPATGTMIIESIPSGASVYIDGSLKGITPVTIPLIAEGNHAVILKMTGYADFPSTATIPAGGEFREIHTMSCNILSVDSIPSGASLTVDGALQGTTPRTVRAILPGDHTVSLNLAGYEDYTTTVNVPPGVEVNLVGTMASVSTVKDTRAVLPSVSVTTRIPVSRGTTTTPATTVPVTQTTQQITMAQSGACTMHYFGSGTLDTSSDGRVNCTTIVSTDDRMTTIQIPGGTRVMDREKKPVPGIRIIPVNTSDMPSDTLPDGSRWTGRAYHYLPDHASFDPPVLVSFSLDQDEWNRWEPANLTIRETNQQGPGWQDLPTTVDPVTRTLSAPASHFSIMGLFSTSPAAVSPITQQSPLDILRTATRSGTGPLPLSPVIPDRYAPLAAVVAGVALSVLGTLAHGSATISRLWDKIFGLLEKFAGSETIGLMNAGEIEKRGLQPSKNLSGILLGLSSRELMVIGLSTLGFAAAFILQDHLEVKLTTVLIFVCVGGIATILHDLAHKFGAYRAGCITEYQFWSLGTFTMLSTAWLFGNAFAKPSRTLIRSETILPAEDAALIRLAGPLTSMGVAILSLFLIPLGGLFVIAGSAGFSMNLLNCVFSLVPVKPNDGVEIYAWNKLVWAIVFIPVMVFYLYIYVQM